MDELRIKITPARAVAIVTLGLGCSIAIAQAFFHYVHCVRGIDDGRDEQASIAFAVVMVAIWLVSMALILRGGHHGR